MSVATADLYDRFADRLQVVSPGLRSYGGSAACAGPMATLKVHEDNVLVRSALEGAGEGRVLVVDGGGSQRCALVGDILARFGVDNGWAGIIVNGCIRDSAAIATMPIGVWALATNPAKSVKRGEGQADIAVRFGDVMFRPGEWLYADADGIVVAPAELA